MHFLVGDSNLSERQNKKCVPKVKLPNLGKVKVETDLEKVSNQCQIKEALEEMKEPYQTRFTSLVDTTVSMEMERTLNNAAVVAVQIIKEKPQKSSARAEASKPLYLTRYE